MAGIDSYSYNLNVVFARPDILICLLSSLSVFDIHPAQMNAFKASCFFFDNNQTKLLSRLSLEVCRLLSSPVLLRKFKNDDN